MVFCLFACALGALLAVTLPVGIFAVGLIAVAAVKAGVALLMGASLAAALLWSFALFGCGQLGYVLGMAVQAAHGHRVSRDRSEAAPEPRPNFPDPLLK